MKLLVGMLSHGENERQQAIDALKSQSYKDWDFFEIRDKPNKQAHQELYATFMSSGADCYLKLDADMVLKADILGFLVDQTRSMDITMVDVNDWPSMLAIAGMQIFSKRCVWENDGDDRLMVDVTPRFQTRQDFEDKPWVDHMPDPHDFESFRYGVHKALKVMQPDRQRKDIKKALLHYTILRNIWKHRNSDRRRKLMIAGAECVFSGQFRPLLDDYAGDYCRRVFEEHKDSDISRFASFWNTEINANERLQRLQRRVW